MVISARIFFITEETEIIGKKTEESVGSVRSVSDNENHSGVRQKKEKELFGKM
jgi:hypothetical protein